MCFLLVVKNRWTLFTNWIFKFVFGGEIKFRYAKMLNSNISSLSVGWHDVPTIDAICLREAVPPPQCQPRLSRRRQSNKPLLFAQMAGETAHPTPGSPEPLHASSMRMNELNFPLTPSSLWRPWEENEWKVSCHLFVCVHSLARMFLRGRSDRCTMCFYIFTTLSFPSCVIADTLLEW